MSHSEALLRPTIWRLEERKSMKRTFPIILAALAATLPWLLFSTVFVLQKHAFRRNTEQSGKGRR